ncbi:hypothetical protein V1512DRAFT_277995 [Lipomyces arxii]|uniref:uncharacterized protein n=1 Tax=Lipomyces arxii TaxID=56418 RepID=UPI0034CD04CC
MAYKRPARHETKQDGLFIGTPLDEKSQFVPVWEQNAVDERGRRRFHGAFTGGFSAGYFNTVGSKEGWTPRTFKSSRTSRAEKKEQSVDEFMDEEDLAERRAGEKIVSVGSGVGLKEDRVGYELLRAMGWKTGFGIGPAVLRIVAGRNVMMPPKEVEGESVVRVLGVHGLGYDDEDEKIEKEMPMNVSRSKGIGVGVLNEDDEDEYEIKPIASLKRKRKVKGERTVKKVSGKCHDGRVPLGGFIVMNGITSVKEYSVTVPDGFTSGTFVMRDPDLPAADVAKLPVRTTQYTNLNAADRQRILGAEGVKEKSVFDFMTPAQRDRIANLTGNSNLPPGKSETGHVAVNDVPILSVEQARTALAATFMPYADDPDKKARYVAYLKSQVETKSIESSDMRELREFYKAASLFRPLKGMLANRFTSSTDSANTKTSVVDNNAAVTKRQDTEAAEMGMYGPLTRKVMSWAPAQLLCKRFGIRPPVDLDDAVAQTRDLLSTDTMVAIATQADIDPDVARRLQATAVDPDVNPAIEKSKPGADVFAAIFGDDNDE